MIAASWPQDLSGPIASWFDVLMIGDWFNVKTALDLQRPAGARSGSARAPRMLVVEKIRPQVFMAALSARSSKALARYRDALEDVVRKTGVDLILVGNGAWRDANGTHRVHTFSELQGALS